MSYSTIFLHAIQENHTWCNCEIITSQACQQHLLETCDFTSNCGKEKEQTEDNQQNQCSQEIEVNSNSVDDHHESVLRPKAATCSNVVSNSESLCFVLALKFGVKWLNITSPSYTSIATVMAFSTKVFRAILKSAAVIIAARKLRLTTHS